MSFGLADIYDYSSFQRSHYAYDSPEEAVLHHLVLQLIGTSARQSGASSLHEMTNALMTDGPSVIILRIYANY